MMRKTAIFLCLLMLLCLVCLPAGAQDELTYVRVYRFALYQDGFEAALAPVSTDAGTLVYRISAVPDPTLPLGGQLEDLPNNLLGSAELVSVGGLYPTNEDGRVYMPGLAFTEGTYACQFIFSPTCRSQIFLASTAPSALPAQQPIVPVQSLTIERKVQMYNHDIALTPITWEPTDANTFPIKVTYSTKGVVNGDNGILQALKKGESYVYVQAPGGKRISTAVTVSQHAESIEPEPQTVQLVAGKTRSLTVAVLPKNASNKKVAYASTNESVATVSASGVIKGIGLGECTITITSQDDPAVTAGVQVRVIKQVSKITVEKPSPIYVDQTTQLQVTIEPEDASEKAVAYSSSNTSVATVDESGMVTAHKRGSATITVTAQDGSKKSGKTTVVVYQQPTSLTMNKTAITLATGKALTLSARVSPSNANDVDLIWASSDESIATVSAKGVVRGVYPGPCVITVRSASFPDVYAECAVTVTQQATGIAMEMQTISLLAGQSENLSYQVLPDYATNKAVSFTSADRRIATVNESGLVTAVKAGKTTITVKAEDGSRVTGKVTVQVVQPLYGMAMQHAERRVGMGNTIKVYAIFTPSDATNKTLYWSSDNESIATVRGDSGTARVTGHAWGDCTISAVSEEGHYTDSMTIHVGDLNQAVRIRELDIMYDNYGRRTPAITLRNESNMVITRVNYVILAENWHMSNLIPPDRVSGSYRRTMQPGTSTRAEYFYISDDYDFSNINYMKLLITGYVTEDGSTHRIDESVAPYKEWGEHIENPDDNPYDLPGDTGDPYVPGIDPQPQETIPPEHLNEDGSVG